MVSIQLPGGELLAASSTSGGLQIGRTSGVDDVFVSRKQWSLSVIPGEDSSLIWLQVG